MASAMGAMWIDRAAASGSRSDLELVIRVHSQVTRDDREGAVRILRNRCNKHLSEMQAKLGSSRPDLIARVRSNYREAISLLSR